MYLLGIPSLHFDRPGIAPGKTELYVALLAGYSGAWDRFKGSLVLTKTTDIKVEPGCKILNNKDKLG